MVSSGNSREYPQQGISHLVIRKPRTATDEAAMRQLIHEAKQDPDCGVPASGQNGFRKVFCSSKCSITKEAQVGDRIPAPTQPLHFFQYKQGSQVGGSTLLFAQSGFWHARSAFKLKIPDDTHGEAMLRFRYVAWEPD
jgi:hypothetical protein